MKRKTVLLLVSGLMALSLVLASCAPAVEEIVTEEGKVMVRDMLGRLVEKPRQGGTLNFIFHKTSTGWDAAYTHEFAMQPHNLALEDLISGDWTKGPYGTNEFAWEVHSSPAPEAGKYGLVAESWEMIDPVTKIYHIRQGVHFHNKPPTNGRELTADDVVATINYQYGQPKSYLSHSTPGDPVSVKALDRYTVELKWADPVEALYGFPALENNCKIFAADALEKYGDMSDWRNVIGTGPYMVEDEIAATSILFARHPNFWEKDPMHPDLDLQLPYADKVKWVVIKDAATRLAAIRTGKADLAREVSWEDAEQMKLTRPDLTYHEYSFTATCTITPRVDNPEFPWTDKRVRHALYLAMDNQAIADEFFGGYADMLAHPFLDLPDFKDLTVPLEELPQSTQELYEYHPDKAKQLMIEAGYADGFELEVVTKIRYVDMLSMIKAMWADINVDLIIDVRDDGVFTAMSMARTYKHALFHHTIADSPIGFAKYFHPTLGQVNYVRINDPIINENREQLEAAMLAYDDAEIARLIKEVYPYILDQAYYIQPPNYHLFFVGQPWLKRFTGIYSLGCSNYFGHFKYLWLDQELKKELGY